MKVLVVDDIDVNRKLLRLTLKGEGHEVVEAGDGVQALEKLREGTFDAVISDILMPRMDGYRFCLEVRKTPALSDLPIIIYTSTYKSDSDEKLALSVGADRFLRKPSPAKNLFEALEGVVEGRSRPREQATTVGELDVLKEYSESLVRKLEERNQELEESQKTLAATMGQVQESKAKLSELVDFAPIGIFEVTPDGVLVSSNAAFVDRLGYDSAEELLRLEPARFIFFDPSELASLLTKLEGRAQDIEIQLKKKDGTPAWFELNSRAVRAPSGATMRYEVFAIDINARKTAEKESFESSHAALQGRGAKTFRDVVVGALLAVLVALVVRPLLRMEEKWVDEVVVVLIFLAAAAFVFSYRRLRELRGVVLERVRVEQALRFLRGDLESRVEARTAELRKANEGLRAEVEARTRAADALRKSEKRFALAFNSSPVPTMISEAESGHILDVNEQFVRTLGYGRGEVIGRTALELGLWNDPRDRTRISEKIAREGEALLEEVQLRTRSGGIRDVVGSIVQIDVGSLRSALSTFIDITERKRAEEEVRNSEQRVRALMENAIDAIYVSSMDGVVLEVNRAAEELQGRPRAEIVGRPTVEVVAPEERENVGKSFQETLSRGSVLGFETVARRADGKAIPIEVSATVVQVGERQLVHAIVRDVSARRQLEEQFRQAQKMEAVGQLAGGIAHDFNNVLTVILGNGSLLATRLGPDASGREELEEILQAGERAAALTRQLLAFSRRQVLEPVVLSVNELIRNLEKMLARLVGEHLNLVTRTPPSVGNVRADAGQIEQVIMNLVVNARDAMPDGGQLTIETANVDLDEAYAQRHSVVRPGRYVMVAVSDTGIGMSVETQARIFEPFFTTKEKGKGTGLGLSTTYGIVKQSGGSIWVYSEPGKGTTFKVYLPRVEEAAAEGETLAGALPVGGNETILLVEDEPSIRALSCRVLEELGYRVLEAGNGREALERVRREAGRIHLLVTDLVMPEMSGTELASRLRVADPALRILFMSGYTDDGVVRNGLIGKDHAFLQKPFTPHSLTRKVREALS